MLGYWTAEHEWVQHCKPNPIPAPRSPRLLLIGDSHTRVFAQELQRVSKFASVDYTVIHGISLIDNDTDNPHKYWVRDELLRDKEQHVIDAASQADVLVLNAGQWSLRDLTLDVFRAEAEYLVQFFERVHVQHPSITLVWRTILPYSYKHRSGDYRADRRSNPRIAEANTLIQSLLSNSTAPVFVHDSWQILAPFWDQPCDTNHYLCPDNSTAHGLQDAATFTARFL